MAKTKKPRAKRTNADVLSLARRFFRLGRVEVRAKKRKGEAQAELLDELAARGLKTLSIGDTQITRVQTIQRGWNADGVLRVIPVRQRVGLVRLDFDLNALPDETRRRVLATLTKRELAAISTPVLLADQLEAEIAAGRISEKVVGPYRTEAASAPYIKVTDAPA